ncbi:hypothetical protein HD806DRAFT_501532 [Xylariaceae sp. AK1471]|nr:hypothetical protein HD806DRAFT_501532 [Xylariaceae sp. AK1471]
METTVRIGRRWVEHHCKLAICDCKCDPFPCYKDAAAIATELGLTLREADWTGSPNYAYQHKALQEYKALLAAMSTRAVLKELRECALTSSQSQRAWEALQLDEAVDARAFMADRRRKSQAPRAKDRMTPGDKDIVRTRVRLLKVSERVERVKATMEACIFISDSADSQDRDAVETWKVVNELTVGVVYKQIETEVIVAVEETVVSTITYDERSRVLLRCVGQVGMALELLAAVGRLTREISYDSSSYSWVVEFEDVGDILASSIGVAAMSDIKAANPRGKVQPSGSSGWMTKEMFKAMLKLLPVREGFVDLRECGMQSTVRPVSFTYTQLLCPLCWVTGEPNSHSPAVQIQPLRLVGSSDKHDEYTAVSHLWSEFSGDDTLCSMQNGAAIVGGPASLWIDKLCINQDDNDEKATELSHMGSYYAGARTTLICPARQVVGVPLSEQSRHLVAIPGHLKDYQGLRSWRQDPWHDRVWTFQEAYLSRNPQVVNSETNAGLNACWLDFIAYAAELSHPTRCEIGLPPFHRQGLNPSYGTLAGYSTPFRRGWAACSHHNWAPDISSIKMPLGKLLDLTHNRKCTEERDRILGVLGVALSTEQFLLKGIASLDDAYREAVRCGALGAEVLLADLGGTTPNSCWIPKNGIEANHLPYMGDNCNALRPVVDSNGRLICTASEVDMDMDDRVKYEEGCGDVMFNLRMHNGTSDAHVQFHGSSSTQGKVYMLAAANDTDSLKDRILVWASDTGRGTHHIKGTGRIKWGHRYHNSKQPRADKEDEVITLRLG